MTSPARQMLAPLTLLYRFGLALRERSLQSGREPIRRLPRPVVSVGNLSTGGAGKTPLTIALAQALAARGVAVDVLSRGFGRQGAHAARVDSAGAAAEFGDEPLLIARTAGVPVYVASARYDAGMLAEAEHPAALHLLDDGFQHRQLHRDVDILLLQRADLNDRLLPAGNLREPLKAARRAHILAIPADDPEFERDLRARGLTAPVWRLRRRMEIPQDVIRDHPPVIAFCGIARPQQFFAGLEAANVRLAARFAFPDHHRYDRRDLERLQAALQRTGATALLTTEKDAVRLEPLHAPLPIRTVPLRTGIDDESSALDWLLARVV